MSGRDRERGSGLRIDIMPSEDRIERHCGVLDRDVGEEQVEEYQRIPSPSESYDRSIK
jgi:hypothetical protein